MTARQSLRVAALLALAAGCSGHRAKDDRSAKADQSANSAEALTKSSELGPVEATVEVTPAAPRLGDPITLTLTVTAAAGVEVDMPGFGEALGRFTIVDFTPRTRTLKDGGTEQSQRYTLQAPMSGDQRIPPLRVAFVDRRPGQAGADAGVGGRELLTEEVPIQIASVAPEGELSGELRPARGRLEPPEIRSRVWPWLAGVAALLLVVLAVVLIRRRAGVQVRISAYDKAVAGLDALERRGPPDPSTADSWYVELSGVVRRYLEDRYRLRAPELTTEEFLREARRSPELTPEHRALLSSFLEDCDRVKFAGYRPGEGESRAALGDARRFVHETRMVETPPAPAAAA